MAWSLRGVLRRVFGLRASADPFRQPGAPRPAYNDAADGRRFRGLWAPELGPNAALQGSLDVLRARNRAAGRSNPWASNAIDALVANTVGTHIKPEPQHEDPAFREAVMRLWTDWTDEADADGLTDFYGLQAMVAHGLFEAGEIFARLRPRLLTDGLAVPLQVQLFEAEHCPTWKSEALPVGKIVCGVEFDAIGRRVAYWLYREHPGDFVSGRGASEPARVPAEAVIHVFRPRRPGQVRGEPQGVRVTGRLNHLDEYDDAELTRKKAAANIGGVMTCADPDIAAQMLGGQPGDARPPEGAVEAQMEAGTILPLTPGYDFKPLDPADVGPNFDVFIRHQLHGIAAGMALPYEELTWDFSQTNYSSSRSAQLQHRRRIEPIRHHVLVFQFCRAVWSAWMDAAVASGALRAPNYATRRREYQRVKWIAQGWPWIDPLKDAQASQLAVRSGFTTRRAIVAEQGENVEQIDEEQRQDAERADRLGLSYDSDGRRPQATPATSASADAPDAPRAPRRAAGGATRG